MTSLGLSSETLDELEKQHVAFLSARLTSDQAREDWIRSFREGWTWALGLRIGDVLDPDAVTDGVARALGEATITKLIAPVLRDVHRRTLQTLRTDDARLAEYVDAGAREAIDALLERSDLVPEKVIREVFAQEAIEEALRDILFDGLQEFNQTVNPFFADWGLPAILKRMPIGGGTILKSMGAMKGEFDKRLEPEIRKFLQVFSRKAKGKLADAVVTRGGDPKMVELRKNVVSFLYTQTLSELLANVDSGASQQAELAVERIALRVLQEEHPRRRLREAIDAFLRVHKDKTVGEWLTTLGATETPDLDAWAALLWPHVQRTLASPVARSFFAQVTREFYASLRDGP
jgi:hypothetical protein